MLLLLSVQPPQAVDPALCPALQELLARCRVCVQRRSALELEAKDHKAKGNGARVHRGGGGGAGAARSGVWLKSKSRKRGVIFIFILMTS